MVSPYLNRSVRSLDQVLKARTGTRDPQPAGTTIERPEKAPYPAPQAPRQPDLSDAQAPPRHAA